MTKAGVVHLVKTGGRGRPKKIIDKAFLQESFAPHRRINQTFLGKKIGCSQHTIRNNRTLHGISNSYSNITDAELDHLVQQYKMPLPRNGWRYVTAYLGTRGFKVQIKRVKSSLRRVDRLGVALRQRRGIKRRDYSSKRPNYLWHCDGHHKLIRWGIVIHGFVDGYCRTVSSILSSAFCKSAYPTLFAGRCFTSQHKQQGVHGLGTL